MNDVTRSPSGRRPSCGRSLSAAEVREFRGADGITEPRDPARTLDRRRPSGAFWVSTPAGIGFIDPAQLPRSAADHRPHRSRAVGW